MAERLLFVAIRYSTYILRRYFEYRPLLAKALMFLLYCMMDVVRNKTLHAFLHIDRFKVNIDR